MDDDNSIEKAIENAFSSAQMEGFRITPQIERNTRKLIDGQISVRECVSEMLSKPVSGKSTG